MKTFIIYHKADLDGLFGGAVIDNHIEGEKVYVPYNYGDTVDLVSMENNFVYMVDCSIIAKVFGGGGHKGAAGFICKKLPFNI